MMEVRSETSGDGKKIPADRGGNSYRSILRGTSMLGGVQMFQIIVNLLRGKFVALLLGPEGMGIAALFTTAGNTVQKFSSAGLNMAIVKEVAAGEGGHLRDAMGVARRLTMTTALVGALVCMLFCVPLSRLTFGDDSNSGGFILLGISVFFGVAGAGLLSMLQGLHEVRRLSRASLVGALAGLLIGVPLYYFFGNDGIVPAMIVLALTMYIFYELSLRHALRERGGDREFRFVWQRHKPIVKRLLSLGIMLMASDMIGTAMNYILYAVIRYMGDVDAVGLYQAANSLTNQYSGVVFSAMAMDYFPRLSAASRSGGRMTVIANRQMEIVSLIIAPAAALLILTAPLVIRILLTEKFLVITSLMRWMGLGVMFKAMQFPLGYISFAKGNKQVFFWLEGVAGNVLTFGLGIAGYVVFGLIGLGYALVADCILCTLLYMWVNGRMFGYRTRPRALRAMLVATFMGSSVFVASYIPLTWLAYTVMSLLTLVSLVYSLRNLRRLMRR